MIDPTVSAAFGMFPNPGVYALLLGSGVSRPADIPTGYEITLDLVRKLASLQESSDIGDAWAWYTERFGKEPEYTTVLEQLAPEAAERCQLLKKYFEPSQQDREDHLKEPTKAHKAIANLVVGGFVRVIVTTNFDRLLEKALEGVGITAVVLSTPDAIGGALPLSQSRCTIIKTNGDYLDLRIKNTPRELSEYDARLNRLLDQAFDEYGLIISGWSAEWDVALRAAIERCPSRRFSTYWTYKDEPDEYAQQLMTNRSAIRIEIRDADTFFSELQEKVSALQEISKPHPLSAEIAVATVKRYLVEETPSIPPIRLHDMAVKEALKLQSLLLVEDCSGSVPQNPEEVARRVRRYDGYAEMLASILSVGCYWGGQTHLFIWQQCLELACVPPKAGQVDDWAGLRVYPGLKAMYAGGLAALVRGRFDIVKGLLVDAKARSEMLRRDVPLALFLAPTSVFTESGAQRLPDVQNALVARSVFLEAAMKDAARQVIPDSRNYKSWFERFEYFFSLVHCDLYEKENGHFWAPLGSFAFRGKVERELGEQLSAQGDNWPPLQAGLFAGSLDRLNDVKGYLDQRIQQSGWK